MSTFSQVTKIICPAAVGHSFIQQSKGIFNWKFLTSWEIGGRNCLCSSIIIRRQINTFSSLSICQTKGKMSATDNGNQQHPQKNRKKTLEYISTSRKRNITDKMFFVCGRRCSFVGIRWIISSTSFLNCWKNT